MPVPLTHQQSQGCESPALFDLHAKGLIPHGRALVPGMGRGYDVTFLASPERVVYGVDIVEVRLYDGIYIMQEIRMGVVLI